MKINILIVLILIGSLQASASNEQKCNDISSGLHGVIEKITDIPNTNEKLIFIRSDGALDEQDKDLLIPFKVKSLTQLIFWSLNDVKSEIFIPKVGEKIFFSFENSNICIFKSTSLTLSALKELNKNPDTVLIELPPCKIKNKTAFEKALLISLEPKKSNENLLQQFEMEKEFITKTEPYCNETQIFYYYRYIANFPKQSDDLIGLKRVETLQIDKDFRKQLQSPHICGVDPETQYQELMKKSILTDSEQSRLLSLENELSNLLLLSSYSPPDCLKYKIWEIDFKAVEERMKNYRICSGVNCGITWETYSNPKIQKNGRAFIIETLRKFTTSIIVPGEFTCEGLDGPCTSEQDLSKEIIVECRKYPDKVIRQAIKDQVQKTIKEMDSDRISNEDDEDPTPAQHNKIMKERRRIRNNLIAILKKNCS